MSMKDEGCAEWNVESVQWWADSARSWADSARWWARNADIYPTTEWPASRCRAKCQMALVRAFEAEVQRSEYSSK